MSRIDEIRFAYECVMPGHTYTREHFHIADSTFVGHTPARTHEAALDAVLEGVPFLLGEVERLQALVSRFHEEMNKAQYGLLTPREPESLESGWWHRETPERIVTDCKELRDAKKMLGEGVELPKDDDLRAAGLALRDVLCRYLTSANPQDIYESIVQAYNEFCKALAVAAVVSSPSTEEPKP